VDKERALMPDWMWLFYMAEMGLRKGLLVLLKEPGIWNGKSIADFSDAAINECLDLRNKYGKKSA
jgi:hypothetical protein